MNRSVAPGPTAWAHLRADEPIQARTAPPLFRISLEQVSGTTTLHLEGDLDLSTVPELRATLATILTRGRPENLIVDLTALNYVDSTGLSCLVLAHKRSAACGVHFFLSNPDVFVTRILDICGLNQFFTLIKLDESDPADEPEGDLNLGKVGDTRAP